MVKRAHIDNVRETVPKGVHVGIDDSPPSGSNSNPILNIPILSELADLYSEVVRGEAAICHFHDYGPRNSRWLNLQASQPHNLKGLILRICEQQQTIVDLTSELNQLRSGRR